MKNRPESIASETSNEDAVQQLSCIITYHPNLRELQDLILRVQNDQTIVLVIDNGRTIPPCFVSKACFRKVRFATMLSNVGIATALNFALEAAVHEGVKYLHTFDQDSLPAKNCARILREALSTSVHRVACGPMIIDARTSIQFKSIPEFKLFRQRKMLRNEQVMIVDHLITSGTLFRVASFKEIGSFNDGFFIDYVDIEWCLRARNLGYQCVQIGSTYLQQKIGSRCVRLLGRNLPIHEPERGYFQVKNGISLCINRNYRLPWRLNMLANLLVKCLFVSVAGRKTLKRVYWQALGLRDALRSCFRAQPVGVNNNDLPRYE
jgi:rhamnosyltransferase